MRKNTKLLLINAGGFIGLSLLCLTAFIFIDKDRDQRPVIKEKPQVIITVCYEWGD